MRTAKRPFLAMISIYLGNSDVDSETFSNSFRTSFERKISFWLRGNSVRWRLPAFDPMAGRHQQQAFDVEIEKAN